MNARLAMLSVGLVLSAGHVPDPVMAQDLPADATKAMCMVRPAGEGAGLDQAIVIPAANARRLAREGYRPRECSKAFGGQSAMLIWRDRMCRLASSGNDYLNAQTRVIWGEQPAVLCGMAQAVLGVGEGR